MKKEILFRGKRIDNDQWVYGFLKSIEEIGSYYVCTQTVGQFTGLTDKNGVKIFEGDIIESDGTIFKLRDFDDLIEFYYWHRECVILEEYTTIIGNIHDI